MTLKLLNNLLRLQVPNIDTLKGVGPKSQSLTVVLRAADDPLPRGDGKSGEYTILFVFVPLVGFKALSRRIIPQPQGAIKGSGQNKFAVRGKLYERAARYEKKQTGYTGGLSSS